MDYDYVRQETATRITGKENDPKSFKIREFVFTSREIGDPGDSLVKASRQMRNLCKKHPGPFVASISKKRKKFASGKRIRKETP